MNCRMNLNKWQICEPVFWPFYSSLYVTRFSGSRTELNERHELHSCQEMSNRRFYKNYFIGASFSVEILVFFFEKCCANDSNWNWIGRECKCWFKNRKTTSTTFFLVFVGNSGIRTWSLNVIVFFLFLSLSLFHFFLLLFGFSVCLCPSKCRLSLAVSFMLFYFSIHLPSKNSHKHIENPASFVPFRMHTATIDHNTYTNTDTVECLLV